MQKTGLDRVFDSIRKDKSYSDYLKTQDNWKNFSDYAAGEATDAIINWGRDYASRTGILDPAFKFIDDILNDSAADAARLDTWTTDFGGAESTTCPLVLDLNGDGVQTTRLSNSFTQGVHFNLDATGLAENTAWVDAQDGLLVRDLDADGQISSGRELFGNHTLLHNGAQAANGFEALAELDDNADGVVDANDALFASLKVWKDANSNGVTDAGELLTLAQNNFVREFTPITVSDAAKALPNLKGSGWVRDLQEAATLSQGLITLVNQAKDAPTRTDYKNAVVGLLHKRENNHDYKKRFNYRARNKNKIKNISETVFLETVT